MKNGLKRLGREFMEEVSMNEFDTRRSFRSTVCRYKRANISQELIDMQYEGYDNANWFRFDNRIG